MAPNTKNDFLIEKTNLFKTTIEPTALPSLQEGEVLIKVEKYAFTSNNITYAVVGDRIKYWNFFPATDPWGIVPVWGFGKIVASNHDSVEVGERFYGYLPMSDYLIVQPNKVNPFGFSDMSTHRAGLSPIYNFYSRISADPSYHASIEDYLPLIKPLFATAFLIYHFLKDHDFHTAQNIVLTSASSKTAYGLAFLLKKYQATDGKKIIGLTSKKNVAFVEKSAYYDEVVPYEDATSKLSVENTVVVDFAGNAGLLNKLNSHLGEALKHIALIGLTDWSSDKGFAELAVAKFFFAPTHMENKYKDWGPQKTNQLLGEEMHAFIGNMKNNMEITFITNQNELKELYLNMLKGSIDPSKGYIVKL